MAYKEGLKEEPAAVCRWQALPASLCAPDSLPVASVIGSADLAPINASLSLWDIWPVQLDDGSIAPVGGGDLWVMLSAPKTGNPEDRHAVARMRLLHRVDGHWQDCGDLLPDGFSPGNREWSGSTRLDPASGQVTLWFTATGRRGQPVVDFEQRLFHVVGQLDLTGPHPRIVGWQDNILTVRNEGVYYADPALTQGAPGTIKGFRDPYWFRDPADGQGYILFTGSKPAAASQSDYDGVIGIAIANNANGLVPFTLLPPLIDGDGQSNELERPHVFVHDGLYYLFWSSQKHVFAPGSLEGPTGLYGMVAPSLFGPYEPLNGSGLVLANPASEPRQAYAWQVIPGTLEVISFIDYWGLQGRDLDSDPALRAAQFGGTVAPFVRIALDGATSRVIEGGA